MYIMSVCMHVYIIFLIYCIIFLYPEFWVLKLCNYFHNKNKESLIISYLGMQPFPVSSQINNTLHTA